MPPQFIYFDMGNVLLYFSHERMAEQMGRVAGIPAQAAWKILFDDGLEWAYERGELSREQFLMRFCEAAGSRPDLDALEQAGNDIFTPNTPIIGLVGRLAGAGYRLGVLSNTTLSHWNYCRSRYGFLRTMFTVPAMSYEFKSMKPAAKIYAAAAELAGVAASQIFFIDDRPENVSGAIAAGWDAVTYESVSQVNQALYDRGVLTNF